MLTDPKGIGSAHYLIRAQDGQVTQMLENKHLAWHAGNWTHNMHTIGVEHEGFAIKEGSWYTEPQYRSSAELVKFLAQKYGVPIDREHIIGHDEVALQTDAGVKDLHWDAGPYWDWNHYMSLLGAPQGDKGAGGPLRAGQVVRVVPPFTTANQPELAYEDEATKKIVNASPRPSNFVYLRTEPSAASATLVDPYFSSLWTWARTTATRSAPAAGTSWPRPGGTGRRSGTRAGRPGSRTPAASTPSRCPAPRP